MEVGNPSMGQGKGKKPSKDGRTKRGCIEVYTDVEKGLETYKIGRTLVTQRILTDYEEEIYAQYSPYNIAGLKKIQISSPPSPPRPRPSPPIDQAVLKERYRLQTAKVAEVALPYFNKKHRTDYELVEALHSAPEYDQDGNWMHANFTAKLKTAPDGGNGDSSVKLFFAERRSTKPGRYEITACCIIDGVKASTPCGICPNNGFIRHPPRFRKGRYSYQLRYLRPRKVCGSKI